MRLVAPVLALAAALAVGAALPAVDATRTARSIDNALLFLPEGRQLRMAATGQEELLSDVLWMRAVLTFGERWGSDTSTAWPEWMKRMVLVVTELDPSWRTPYFYGGALLRVIGDLEGSNEVFRRGHEALPDDFFFPFSLGMNAFVYGGRPGEAARWLEVASGLPDAPRWIAGAAAKMRADAGDRRAAVAYLEGVVRDTDREEVRADAEAQLGRLRHDDLVDAWTPLCRQFEAERGRRLQTPDELAAYAGRPLPPNPRGDAWTVGADGVVRSERAEAERVRRARINEMDIIAP